MPKYLDALTRAIARRQNRNYCGGHWTGKPAPATRVRGLIARMGVIATLLAVVGCGSGGPDVSPAAPAAQRFDGPAGPVAYGHIEKLLAPPAAGAAAATTPTLFNNCGAGTFAVVSDGLWAGAAIAGFATGGATYALVLSLSAVAATGGAQVAGAACPTAPLDSQNAQLAIQAQQIQQIDAYLGLSTNLALYAWYETQLENATTNAAIWETNIAGISPAGSSGGLFGNFMNPNGLGLWVYGPYGSINDYTNPTAITDPKQLALDDDAFNAVRTQTEANASFFQNYVIQLSGTDVVFPGDVKPDNTKCDQNSRGCIVQANDPADPTKTAALIRLYQDSLKTLYSKIDEYAPLAQTYNTVTNQDIVPLYDQYNAMLVKFWTQAVYALEQAWTMEWMVNQMNYFRGTNPTATQLTQIPSWSAIRGTHYKYSNQSLELETQAYNAAQLGLALLYAARINQLYQNTLNYIVSDVPVGPQAYPDIPISYTVNGFPYTENRTIDYAGQVSNNTTDNRTPMKILPTAIAGGPWTSAAVLYQFPGLRDVATCVSNLNAYNQQAGTTGTFQDWLQNNPNACPSIFTLADGTPMNAQCDQQFQNCTGSYYDGNTLRPYTSFDTAKKIIGEPMVLTGMMANNLKFCDPSSAVLGWYAPTGSFVGNSAGLVGGAGYLTCGSWYVPQQPLADVTACGFPRANCPTNNEVTGKNAYDYPGYGLYSNFTSIINRDTSEGCSNNLQMQISGNKYPWILTLTDQLPSEMKSCSQVQVGLANPPGTVLSPLTPLDPFGARVEEGSFVSSGPGCSIGFVGNGIGNPLDDISKGIDMIAFGMRLLNTACPSVDGNGICTAAQGNGTGWVLPVEFDAYCENNHPVTLMTAPFINNFTLLPIDLSKDGYECESGPIADQDCCASYLQCTILDGTQYTFTLNPIGNSIELKVQ